MTRALLMAAMAIVLAGCGPQTPEIQTVVSQVIEAQTASILQQVDWQQVATQMKGNVGPNTRINAEGFIKHAAGFELTIDGGQLEFGTQASGTGGRENNMDAILAVLTRWEREDSLRAADVRRLAGEIADAIIKRTASRPVEN